MAGGDWLAITTKAKLRSNGFGRGGKYPEMMRVRAEKMKVCFPNLFVFSSLNRICSMETRLLVSSVEVFSLSLRHQKLLATLITAVAFPGAHCQRPKTRQ
jgi:hypothetical protein